MNRIHNESYINIVPTIHNTGTEGHRERIDERWPKYLAKRLPVLKSLEDSSELLPEERQERREEYAKGVLTMFISFRENTDLVAVGETWWDAYQRQKNTIYADKSTKQR
jgi:hypothetical protein